MGLRWIAIETWLYRLAPIEARGRIVGFHETLIAFAGIIAPLLIVAVGAVNASAFGLALGGLIAGCGGWIEGSLLALLPVYNSSMGFSSKDSAWLFTVFGFGAFSLQFLIGWWCDKKGVIATAKICGLLGGIAILLAIGLGNSLPTLAIAIFILGGVTGGLLTLGMIWATLHNNGTAITHRVRQVSIIYTMLSAAGPLVSGYIISQTSSYSLFWQQLVVIFVLAIVLLKQSKPSA